MSKNRVYQMLIHKLIKTKKYLEKNFKRKFINSSFISFASSIFFAVKFNEKFYFCVNYRKLNAIIKKNHYSIFLIEEIFTKIMNYKYLTKLNIIAVFNKLCMHSNNENLIIFVTFIKIYKYYVLFFVLTNELVNYQYYINDVFFKYFNDFVQVYFDDVFIYNKIRKEHIEHVR